MEPLGNLYIFDCKQVKFSRLCTNCGGKLIYSSENPFNYFQWQLPWLIIALFVILQGRTFTKSTDLCSLERMPMLQHGPSNWTQKHYIQNIENLNIWKNSWKSKKIHAISIALSLSNTTPWKLRGFFWDFHEFFDGL